MHRSLEGKDTLSLLAFDQGENDELRERAKVWMRVDFSPTAMQGPWLSYTSPMTPSFIMQRRPHFASRILFIAIALSVSACDSGEDSEYEDSLSPSAVSDAQTEDTFPGDIERADEDPSEVLNEAEDARAEDEGPDVDQAPPPSFGLPDLSGQRSETILDMPGLIGVQPAIAIGLDGLPLVVFAATPGAAGDLSIYAAREGEASISLRTEPPGQRNEPSVCRLSGGGFVAAWSYDGQAYGYTLGIEVALMDSSGALIKAFEVKTEVEGNHWLGHVGCNPSGGFTLVGSRTDTDDTTFGVFAQYFSEAGDPEGQAFTVNPSPEGTQVQPVVGVGPSGDAIVVYEDAPADSSYALSARSVGPNGPISERFTFLSFEGVDCLKPAIALSKTGALAYAGNLGVQVHVQGAAGVSAPEPKQTWLSTTGSQGMPAITFLEGDDVLALAMIDQLTGEGDPLVKVELLGEGLASETRVAYLSDDPTLPPYPPAIAYGAGTLAIAWTQRTEGGFEIHLSRFQAPEM